MHRLTSLVAVAAALIAPLACSSSSFQMATDPASGDAAGHNSNDGGGGSSTDGGGGNSTDGGGGVIDSGPSPECLEPKPAACLTPASGHSPIWSTTPGTLLEPRLAKLTAFAFEMNVLVRARLDKFEVPMAIEGTECDGVVTVRVMVETCPGVWVDVAKMDRRAADMKASSNYWWFNAEPPDLPWFGVDTRYRFEVRTNSESCKFRIAGLPAGQTREPGARFDWYVGDHVGNWTKQPGFAVAVPWIARCSG